MGQKPTKKKKKSHEPLKRGGAGGPLIFTRPPFQSLEKRKKPEKNRKKGRGSGTTKEGRKKGTLGRRKEVVSDDTGILSGKSWRRVGML